MEITRIALFTAVVGIIALFILSAKLEPKMGNIIDLDKARLGDFVKISGEIIAIKHDKTSYFDLKDSTDEIRVFSFKEINLTKGDRVEVIGKLDEYRGFSEIQAGQIKKISAEKRSL